MLFKAAALLAILATIVYRNGRVAWFHVLTVPDLPDGYYVGGNYSTHCSLITDPTSDDVNFCEDITFWDHYDAKGGLAHRLLLLGCDPNRKAWNTVMGPLRDPNPRGHLFLYDPSTDVVQRVTLDGYPAAHDFHPLGMDISPSHSGAPSNLFVVNHARNETTIEHFIVDPGRSTSAQFVHTLRSRHFVASNAIALTSPTSFFVTNDHLLTRRLPNPIGHVLPLVETLAALPFGWVGHVALHPDNSMLTHTFSAVGIPFPNGIALSPSRSELAVVSTTLGHVRTYAVGPGHTLTLTDTVPLPFFADNAMYDDTGALIVAGHPHFPALAAFAANKTLPRHPPSWAVSVTPSRSSGAAGVDLYDSRAPLPAAKLTSVVSSHVVETLFQSDGSVFGSSSTALRDARSGAIYVAGLYERGILACRP